MSNKKISALATGLTEEGAHGSGEGKGKGSDTGVRRISNKNFMRGERFTRSKFARSFD